MIYFTLALSGLNVYAAVVEILLYSDYKLFVMFVFASIVCLLTSIVVAIYDNHKTIVNNVSSPVAPKQEKSAALKAWEDSMTRESTPDVFDYKM